MAEKGNEEKKEPIKRVPFSELTCFHGHPGFYMLLDQMANLHSRKNHDYAGSDDPLKNFYECVDMDVTPFQGVMVRMSDKWSRIKSFMRQGILEVKDESIEDTLIDMAVYSLLAILIRRAEQPKDIGVWNVSKVKEMIKEIKQP